MKRINLNHIGSQSIGLAENKKLQLITTTTPVDELIKKEEGGSEGEISNEVRACQIFLNIIHDSFVNTRSPKDVLKNFKRITKNIDNKIK